MQPTLLNQVIFLLIQQSVLLPFVQGCGDDQGTQILFFLSQSLHCFLGLLSSKMQDFLFSFVGPHDILFAHFFQQPEENNCARLSTNM